MPIYHVQDHVMVNNIEQTAAPSLPEFSVTDGSHPAVHPRDRPGDYAQFKGLKFNSLEAR
jgi:hypothetical protein